MTAFSIIILVLGILFCTGFGIASFVFFILWIVSLTRPNPKRLCPSCSAPVSSESAFCIRCGAQLPQTPVQPKKKASKWLVWFIVSVVLIIVGAGAIIAGSITLAQNAGNYVSVDSMWAVNLEQDSTKSSWDISYDSVGSSHLKKPISIEEGQPVSIKGTARLESGTVQIDIIQGDIKHTQFLSEGNSDITLNTDGFEDGKATIVVTIKNAKDGTIKMYWD